MAYLDSTLLNDFQASEATNEKYLNSLGLVDSVKDSTAGVDYIPPSVQQRLSSMSSLRDAQIPVIKDQSVTVVTTPGFANIPSNLAETDQYAFTAYDVFSGFRFNPAAHDNNSMDADFFFNQTMSNVLHGCANQIETILAARLEERKTQVLNYTTQVSQGDGTFTFEATPDRLDISKAAQKETMFYNMQQLMAANRVGGNYRLVTNPAGLSVQMSEAAKFGANNEKNLQALGMLDSSRIYESHNISSSDIFDGWFFRDGAIGMYENYPYDFRNGTMVGNREWSVSDVELPFTRMRANVYVNTDASESTALVSSGEDSNLIMTHFEEMAVWFRFYVVHRYNSDLSTRVNDVVKVRGLSS